MARNCDRRVLEEPRPDNGYLWAHIRMLRESYRRWTGRDLIDPRLDDRAAGEALYRAPFVLLSHGTEADPVFNYANLTAQELFEMDWAEFTRLPSRLSAEPVSREERERLLAEVTAKGFIDHYGGFRISKHGRRFRIAGAVVWNLVDGHGGYAGQAACFSEWETLPFPGRAK